jgi:hypothetical protein
MRLRNAGPQAGAWNPKKTNFSNEMIKIPAASGGVFEHQNNVSC